LLEIGSRIVSAKKHSYAYSKRCKMFDHEKRDVYRVSMTFKDVIDTDAGSREYRVGVRERVRIIRKYVANQQLEAMLKSRASDTVRVFPRGLTKEILTKCQNKD